MYRTMALFVLAVLPAALAERAAAADRVALPPAADIEKASKLIHDLFKADFAKTTAKAKLALAEKLLKQGEETPDDPAAQFVLYREAAELAAVGGDGDLALKALQNIRERFTGVPPEQMEALYKLLATKTATADANLALAGYLLRVVDEAIAEDDLDAAERVAALAAPVANKSKSVRTAGFAAARVKEIEGFKKDAPQVRAALKTLETAPDDAPAAAVAGRYYCFQRGEWAKGLPLLAAGDDAKLKPLAAKDAAGPKEAAEVMAVADAWYDAASTATGAAKRAMLGRAHALYVKAAPDLAGLSRTRTDKRVEELEKVVEWRSQHDELFAAVRTAVRGKDSEELPPLGGIFGNKDYRESAPSGGVLVGFYYGTRKVNNHDVIGYLQPIYLTPSGEKLGGAYGKAPGKPQVVKAKPGYAVGALKIQGGGLLESYSVTFMRIQGKGLNPNDKYESPSMGRDTAGGGRVTGDGRPIVGLFGKRTDGDEDICSIGLVVAGSKPPPPKK